jgi:hypothetical protein
MTGRLPLRILAALVALAGALLAPAAARASHTQTSIFQDDARLIYGDAATRDSTLDELAGLGVRTVRIPLTWNRVAPSPRAKSKPSFDAADPAAYPASGWAPYDAVVQGAAARRITVLFTLTGPAPRWAEGCRVPGRPGICKPSVKDFGDFVRAAGTRYPGVHTWSIWNEPNLYRWLYPQFVRRKGHVVSFAAARYRALFRAGAAALHATGHAADTILVGETSPIGSSGGPPARRTAPPVTFMRDVLCLSAGGHKLRGRAARAAWCGGRYRRLAATGVAHHPYTPGASCTPRCRGGRGDATIASLGGMTHAVDAGGRAGRLRRRLPLWLTEFGFQSNPPNKLAGLRLAKQAEYINWSDWIAFRSPRVKSVAQYELYDDTRDGAFQTGLRLAGGKRKPSWFAYRLPIFVTRSGRAHVRVFGQVRPAGARRVAIQRKARPKAAWKTVGRATVNRAGYLYRRLRARGGSWRLAWSPTTGSSALHSRTARVD